MPATNAHATAKPKSHKAERRTQTRPPHWRIGKRATPTKQLPPRVSVPVVYRQGSRSYYRVEDNRHENVILVDRETCRILATPDGRRLQRNQLDAMLKSKVMRRALDVNYAHRPVASWAFLAQSLVGFEMATVRPIPGLASEFFCIAKPKLWGVPKEINIASDEFQAISVGLKSAWASLPRFVRRRVKSLKAFHRRRPI